MDNFKSKNDHVSGNIESLIKTALIFLIIYACFLIFKPFLIPVVWAIIIAVVVYPIHLKLMKIMRNKSSLSAAVISLLLLAILIVPTIIFLDLLIESMQELSAQLEDGKFSIPPPPDSVADWPVVGKSVKEAWLFFSDNLTAALEHFKPQILSIGEWLLSAISGLVGGVFIFILSIIIAGVFLAKSNEGYKLATNVFEKLVGVKGKEMVDNSRKTISSVVNGVIGTALIQTTIISIGFYVADVPGAPILSIIVLFLAIVQIPVILIVLPVIIYMFTIMSGTGATLLAIWSILGGISDNIFKPMLLGRGMEIPMLIILIGSIGGMMLTGITGLFIGAVILALGYQLFQIWAGNDQEEDLELGEKS
jgi:predicted PurR-regulated permease PerM